MDENDLCCKGTNCDKKDKCLRYLNGVKADENFDRVSWISIADSNNCVYLKEN